jgi:CTP synthase (UTP-ammonia lyase)
VSAVAIVADFDPANETHRATAVAFEQLGARVEWVPTPECEEAPARLAGFGGIMIGPASPYRSMEGALEAVRYARERGVPLVGT